jgi:hypothetical protein
METTTYRTEHPREHWEFIGESGYDLFGYIYLTHATQVRVLFAKKK